MKKVEAKNGFGKVRLRRPKYVLRTAGPSGLASGAYYHENGRDPHIASSLKVKNSCH
jgi:hypothetical protein